MGEVIEEGEGTGPVEMTNEENIMSVEVEELSDEMARENQEVLRATMGQTTIAFFDVQQMGTVSKLCYVIAIIAVFYAVGSWFVANLIDKPPSV